jgi:hypothetical protein
MDKHTIEKLKKIRKSYIYTLLLIGLSILFWYIYFYDKDFNIKSFIGNSLFTIITFDNFIAIFIRLPHRYIPENYPLWKDILMRIFLFLVALSLLIYQLKKDNII